MNYDEYVDILDDVSDSVNEECTAVHKKCFKQQFHGTAS